MTLLLEKLVARRAGSRAISVYCAPDTRAAPEAETRSMKLVDQYIDPSEAAAARRRLRQAGIACIVDSIDPHSIQPSKSGATHIGLWVVAEGQYEDALQLLEDPAYQPRQRLSLNEMDLLEAEAVKRTKSRRLTDRLLTVVLFACLLGLILYTAVDFFLDL